MSVPILRRTFLKNVAACSVGAWAAQAMANPPEKRPNVLVLYSDDQRFNTIHALNNPEIETPHLDRLTREGTAFTWAHTMGGLSGALCIPSRAMLMTGRTLFHLQGKAEVIPPEHMTLGEFFQRQGYATFATGKWHNDRASFARSFAAGGDIFFGGMTDQKAVPVYEYDPSGNYRPKDMHKASVFSSTLFSDRAISFLRSHPKDSPFFGYVAYTSPHDPRTAPEPFAGRYDPAKISIPPNFMAQHPFDNGDLHTRDEELTAFPRTPQAAQEHIAAYYAMISHLDHEIGRILDTLDETGLADNTIIVFAGDNGLAVGQHGLWGKQNVYDHSLRIPLIFRGPGIPRGAQCKALCYQLDVFPTLCELLSLPTPASVEGKSLAGVMRQPNEGNVREHIFGAYRNCQRMVRNHRWKLIRYQVDGKQHTQLFNVAEDPWETRNLADEAQQQQRVSDMTALLQKTMEQLNDCCQLDKEDWGGCRA